ncbi:thiol reductant ABC exporter subunit CydD [Thiocystis violascens]|uniref:Cysteine export CydDC family ABC transporter permease subunit/ATP-binding protein CydD n=1 Tax=Thiocystis violascens (strain ATCC 17096 / DSM 198 / 6111) TaxID=765911 RepID=I3YGK5_THIV6|nr:thiol reductant ABC exporter subunit CydD [Thiocystis violascens]AFL76123.1 cysteine export CydDC family ABC transporter permease subunit/ATP-binding protein CydD [Thiocystis violascens DSM 198]
MSVNSWLKSQRPLAGNALAFTIWLNTANGLLAIVQAWCLAVILNAAIFAGAGLTDVQPWLWSLLGLFALRAAVVWFAERTAFGAAAGVRVALRDRVYRHLQRLGPGYLANQRSGALVETLTKGIDDLEGYYARFLPAMSLTMILPLAILTAVLPMDWLAGLVLMVTAPMIPLFMILIGSGAEARNQRQWKQLARMSAHFLDVIQGLTTLKLFGASRREVQVVAKISDDYRVSTMQVLRIAFLSSAVLEFFATVGIAIVAVFIGFRLYGLALPVPPWLAVPDVTFLQGLFVLMLAPEFYAPLRNLGTQYHARLAAVAAAEQLIQVLEAEPAQSIPGTEPLDNQRPLGVRFESVRFSYEEGRDALGGLDIEIPPGQRIALVGTSGAGKTTVVNLLLGFLTPTGGRILIGAQELSRIDLDDWRRHLAWVPQQPRLFQGSIADNIRLGVPEASLDAVRESARRARADQFIEALPDGYDSRVGERGAGLSGGQIQRIALARAFLRDAPLVILDEATANLDPESERLVQEGIDDLARDRTLLVVAHRLATVRRADRILVLDQGQIVEQGDHATLAAAHGLYARMIAAYGDAGQGVADIQDTGKGS